MPAKTDVEFNQVNSLKMVQEETDLITLVELLEDFEDAGDALLKLSDMNPEKAASLSMDILSERKGDSFFQGTAFDTLYSIDVAQALKYVREAKGFIKPHVFGSILTNVAEDSGIVNEEKVIQDFVLEMKKQLKLAPPALLEPITESVDWFINTYGKP